MSDTISKLIKISLWIIGILIPGEKIYSQNQYTFNIVEIQHLYELPEQYCIVVEDIHSGERFLIETANNPLPIKENTDSISEIYPNEPDLIHVGDTLSIEIAPKYEFMQSLIGLSYLHVQDCPAYRYRDISSKHSAQPWPMASPNLNGLHYIPYIKKE